ncbi:MAG: GerAB/ArcD/ProY family transporter [Clostridia bacterium]|nr:GerAB/ArcD/ProY family transporter [Clostridia bacterium]
MKQKNRIGAAGLYTLFLISRLPPLLTVVSPADAAELADRCVLFAPLSLLLLLAGVPMLPFASAPSRGLLSVSKNRSKTLCAALTGLYTFTVLWDAAAGTAQFKLFVDGVMYPDVPVLPLMLLFFAAAVFIAAKGIETTARMGAVIGVLLAATLASVLLTTLPRAEALNLEPPLQKGTLSFLKSALHAAARTGEPLALYAFTGRVAGKKRVGYALWCVGFPALGSLLFASLLSVAGKSAVNQMFSLYTLTVLSRLGPSAHPDALIAAVWVLCFLVRTAFYLQTAGAFLSQGFGIKESAPLFLILGCAVLAGSLLIGADPSVFGRITSAPVGEALFLLTMFILPVFVHLTRRKTPEEIAEKRRRL